MIKRKSQQAGFTLFEMIIVIFLLAILLVGLLNIFDWQQKVYNLEQADIAATGTARVALNAMTFAIAQGTEIVASRNINGTDYSTGGSTIVVEVPSYDSNGDWLPSDHDYLVFTANGNRLEMITDAAANSDRKSGTKLLTDSLESFALTYNNGTPSQASQVTAIVTTRAYYRGNQSISVTLQETIFLRNK